MLSYKKRFGLSAHCLPMSLDEMLRANPRTAFDCLQYMRGTSARISDRTYRGKARTFFDFKAETNSAPSVIFDGIAAALFTAAAEYIEKYIGARSARGAHVRLPVSEQLRQAHYPARNCRST